MDRPEAIGLWTEIKLKIISEYAAAYTTILKEQSWCRGYAYIDAFAGGGEFVAKEDQERLIPGSPMNALNVSNKFTEYHFIDIEKSKIERLEKLTASRPEKKSIHFYVGDANQVLRKKIIPKFPYSSFKRALCILDPYGVDIEWMTIASLAPIKTMDIFINFPLMDINRNAALKKLETTDPQQGARLTKIWGDDSWKELAYVEQGGLFDAPILIKKIRGNETLKQGFRKRLKQKAGFSCVPEPILMSNMAGGPLYFLFFASQKQVAQNIAQHILRALSGDCMKLAERGSHFIRQFGGPGEDSQIVCFKFWQLVVAGGCPYRCAYCFLQTVPWFRFRPDELYGLVYTNVDDMVEEIKEWLDDPIPKMMIAGELQDGLVFDSAYKKTSGMPLTHRIIPLFAAQKKHRLIFLTKSDQIQHALELPPTPQVVFSWSVNAEEIGAKWEHGTPLPSERFAAAEKMKKAGWPIRFRLDPMVPYPDWKHGYAETIKRINSLSPEMVTLGALRATSYNGLRNAAKANGRDETIFDYLTEEKDPSGFKYRIPFATQVELFRFAVDHLKSSIKPALCKEDRALWKALGMKFDGCHCLLGRNDAIVKTRNVEMKHAREIEPVIGIGKPLPVLA